MKSDPVLINSFSDPGCKLNRVEAKPGDPKDENWLQELLYRHPEPQWLAKDDRCPAHPVRKPSP
jgi:hypothetical protein